MLSLVSVPAPAPLPAVPGWPVAFRGTTATAAGLVTPAELRGPRFLRLFPDTYVRRGPEPPTWRCAPALPACTSPVGESSPVTPLRSSSTPSCGPPDAPAEVTVPGGGQRTHPGLLVHRDSLAADEVRRRGFIATTTPLRTGLRPCPPTRP